MRLSFAGTVSNQRHYNYLLPFNARYRLLLSGKYQRVQQESASLNWFVFVCFYSSLLMSLSFAGTVSNQRHYNYLLPTNARYRLLLSGKYHRVQQELASLNWFVFVCFYSLLLMCLYFAEIVSYQRHYNKSLVARKPVFGVSNKVRFKPIS